LELSKALVRSSYMDIRKLVLVGLILLVGCGHEPKTRATTGSLMGAGGGVALGIATGGIAPLVGAVVGGSAGAVGGAATVKKRSPPAHQQALPPSGLRYPVIDPPR
jgi:hypothetical protein